MSPVTKEPAVDREPVPGHGLSEEEVERLRSILGREPNTTELGVAGALWSGRSAHELSRHLLGELPGEGPYVVHGPGVGAGVVDVGDGWVAVLEMRSNNHPSTVEPYHGASTGVGRVLRDVFAMGARPVACLDSLRFGELDAPGMRHRVDGVVRGIGDHANRVGVPTVGGETGFHASYNGSAVVNAFALGLARRERLATGRAGGSGASLVYVGSRTGRDGLRAARASAGAGGDGGVLPAVQVGDPFAEKVLLEATLAALRTGAVVAVEATGAAGLAGAAFEMAGRGGTGLRLELAKVPLREEGLAADEIVLSASEERMLLVVRRGRREELERIFKRWGVEVAAVGRMTVDGRGVIRLGGEVVADLPVEPLTRERPVSRPTAITPKGLAERQAPPEVPEVDDPADVLARLLETPELASKEWVWRQYDHTVRTNTVLGPGGDAAVLLLKGTPVGLGLACDVNPSYCWLDPRAGAAQAVAEAVRNLACVGAEPVGLTDCLSFGDLDDPEVAWQLGEAVRGMAQACRTLGVPVVASDVSLGNASEERSIHPTPTVAAVGVVPELENLPRPAFRSAGHRVVLLGEDFGEHGGSAYLRLLFGVEQGRPPRLDLEAEARLAELLRMLAFNGHIATAHDLAEGGLAVALAECCFGRGVGARLSVPLSPTALFSESQARAVVACEGDHVEAVLRLAERAEVPAREVGETGGEALVVEADGATLEVEVEALRQRWVTALPRALGI